MHNVLIISYIAFSIGNLFILPESFAGAPVVPAANISQNPNVLQGNQGFNPNAATYVSFGRQFANLQFSR